MSYVIDPRKLKKLVECYSSRGNSQEIRCLNFFQEEQGLLRHLQTSPFQGIDSNSIDERKAEFGSNEMSFDIAVESLFQLLMHPLSDLSTKIILFGSMMSFVSGMFIDYNSLELPWLEGIVFFLCFAVCYILILIPEFSKRNSDRLIQQYTEEHKRCTVWRDNEQVLIPTSELVVGDIIELEADSYVGADGLLIEGELLVQETLGTTSRQVQKLIKEECIVKFKVLRDKPTMESQVPKRPSPILIGGSTVINGEGRMIVLCVGKYSVRGYNAMMIHQSGKSRKSMTEQKVEKVIFIITKYVFLVLLVQLLLVVIKKAVFIVLLKQIDSIAWREIAKDLVLNLVSVLTGMPCLVRAGVAAILAIIKHAIWKHSEIYYRCAKDCEKFDDISTAMIQTAQDSNQLHLKGQWSWQQEAMVAINHQDNQWCFQYQKRFLNSLFSGALNPCEVGLELESFWVGIRERQAAKVTEILEDYGATRSKHSQQKLEGRLCVESIQSQRALEKQNSISYRYFKGNAETLLKVFTHYMDKTTGKIQVLSEPRVQKLRQEIWNINLNEGLSAICGFIEVNPEHPRFRTSSDKIIFVGMLELEVKRDIQQFEALKRVRKRGIDVMLISDKGHEETVSKGKELGIISLGKPSINLRGIDFFRITGGIVCKFCKKSLCLCASSSKFEPTLKSQDFFTSIQKHISTISEASMVQKLALILGYKNSHRGASFMGLKIEDIPAMKASEISITISNKSNSQIVNRVAQVTLKEGNLTEYTKLLTWSYFSVMALKKYLLMSFTSCIVPFTVNFIGLVLFDTAIFNVLQCVWIWMIICPLLGSSFASIPVQISTETELEGSLQVPEGYLNESGDQTHPKQTAQSRRIPHYRLIFDRSYYRQIHSQIIFQTILLTIVLLFGSRFIPETLDDLDEIIGNQWIHKYATEQKNTVCWGVRKNIFEIGQQKYEVTYNLFAVNSRHLTFIFNLYALLQFANYLICRVSHRSSLNVFEHLNLHSAAVFILGVSLHFIFVQNGGGLVGLYPGGLSLLQWVLSLGLSSVGCIFGILVKQIPQQQDKESENKLRFWPNRAHNLAVMTVIPRETLLDFEIEEEFEMKCPANHRPQQ